MTRLGRVWADGDEITLSDYTYRFYAGSETQAPDSLIEAKEGAGNAPAIGARLWLFERLPLEYFGNRLRSSISVVPRGRRFERDVRRDDDPAAWRILYHPRKCGRWRCGTTFRRPAHNASASDWRFPFDHSKSDADCARLGLRGLFGSDLRCGACEIRPKVSTHYKEAPRRFLGGRGAEPRLRRQFRWGLRPAYGGTHRIRL